MAQFALIRSLLSRKVANFSPFSTLISQSVKPKHNIPLLFSYNLQLVSFERFSSIPNKPITNKNICNKTTIKKKEKNKPAKKKMKSSIDFTKIPANLLPTVIIVGRPNVGKSALFNRLIGRREALVYNTPNDHVTRDIREGIAKLGDLRFKVLDSAGLETEAASGTILSRTTNMTANVLARTQFAIFLIDVSDILWGNMKGLLNESFKAVSLKGCLNLCFHKRCGVLRFTVSNWGFKMSFFRHARDREREKAETIAS